MSELAVEELLQAAKSDVGRRLKHARTHHPNGRLRTQAALSEATGLSRRALCDIEAGNSIPNLETLVRITAGLGIQRLAYLLDETVFDEVNRDFEMVEELVRAKEELGVTSVAFRADPGSDPDLSAQAITRVLQHLLTANQADDHDSGSARP